MNKLDQLKTMTTVVADTGDINAIKQYTPQDATTNPSLLLKATNMPEYAHLIDDAVSYAKSHCKTHSSAQIELAAQKLAVNFGQEILKTIPGRVSTEIDARLSFDTQKTIEAGKQLMSLYEQAGISKDRVLLKIAATWEGIEACRAFEKMGFHCNMTLIFGFAQAVACAEVGATLISPFVGRIYDWYKNQGQQINSGNEDPGVLSVKRIYDYFKYFDYPTIVMGASFRGTHQIEALAGCDYLTISPALLAELQLNQDQLTQKLSIDAAKQTALQKINMSEPYFRFELNQDAMATEKLAEGIRLFAADQVKLELMLAEHLK